MNKKQKKSLSKNGILQLRLLKRRYPTIPYLIKWTLICLIIGICIGSSSAGFLQSLEWATNIRETHIWLITLLPLGGFLIGLLYHYLGKDIESGNNLLIDTIHQPKKIIPFRLAPLVYIGTIATHFFGGSAGREGTALQMAGAIADQFSQSFRLSTRERKILLIAAISAGFGSVFGTPIAGAIFGLEVILIGRLKYDALYPAFAASVIADLVTKLWKTEHTLYHINFVPDISFLNIFYIIIAGIIFGVCAAIFSKTLHKTSTIFKSKIAYPPFRPFIGGIIVALSVWILGTTKYIGLGIPTIVQAFDQPLPAYDFMLKMLFTFITLAAGFKGGEVTPLFFIGATLGNAICYFIPLPLELLVGMGFVAVFAGATNTPIACSIMGIELFGTDCGIYAAIACIVAFLISGHNSIYNKQLIGVPKNHRFSHHKGKSINDLSK